MNKFILNKKGYSIELNDNNKNYFGLLLKKFFILKYMSPVTKIRTSINNYFSDKKIIYLPRFKTKELFDKGILKGEIIIDIPEGDKVTFEYKGISNKNQLLVIDHIFKNIFNEDTANKGLSGVILKMQAGSGKTYLAMDMIGRLSTKTLIIVPTTYLLEQWEELLTKLFPNTKIGKFYGKEKSDGDIVIGIVNSVATKDIINDNFGLCVLDECHMYSSKTFKKIYNKVNYKYMLGLSATPDIREDKFDVISYSNIGPVLDVESIEGYNKLNNNFNSSVECIFYDGPNEYTETIINDKTGMVDTISIITNLIQDHKRNLLIIQSIIKLIDKQSNVFVFSDRRNHLEALYNLLTEKNNIEDIVVSIPELNIGNSQILYGGSSKDDINNAKTKSSVIFTTYKYSSTGVSINRLTGLILTTPRKSNMIQIINRIFRQDDQYRNEHRYIIDIIDNKTVLKNQHRERLKAYIERGCKVSHSKIYHEDIEIV